jgi:hypothetical protein
MSPCNIVRVHIFQTELAYVKHPVLAVFFRVWRGVPGINFPSAKVDALDLARGGCLFGRSRRFQMSIQSILLLFPLFLGSDTSLFESFPVSLRRVCFRCVSIGLGEHTTIGLAFGFVFLLRKPLEGWEVGWLYRGVVGKFWRLSSRLCSTSVAFAPFPVSFAPSLLALLFYGESLLLRFSRHNLLNLFIVKVKGHNETEPLSFFDPRKRPLVVGPLRFRTTRSRCTWTRAVLVGCSVLCIALGVVRIRHSTARASSTSRSRGGRRYSR